MILSCSPPHRSHHHLPCSFNKHQAKHFYDAKLLGSLYEPHFLAFAVVSWEISSLWHFWFELGDFWSFRLQAKQSQSYTWATRRWETTTSLRDQAALNWMSPESWPQQSSRECPAGPKFQRCLLYLHYLLYCATTHVYSYE